MQELLTRLGEATEDECFLWIALNDDSRVLDDSIKIKGFLRPCLKMNLRNTDNISKFAILLTKRSRKMITVIDNKLTGN